MNLFEPTPNPTKNHLPKEGQVHYWGALYTKNQADKYLHQLLETIEWRHDEAVMFGKHITTKRKVAWYAEQPFQYTYSNTTKVALPWTQLLLELKGQVEQHTQTTYNSCLLNLYHNGSEGMAWHSDDEKDLHQQGSIASLTFGATRKFAFKHKTTKEKVELWLEHGSLLEMKGLTQRHWLHRLPPTKLVTRPRVNLTFRQMLVKG